jgi:hypothetical protein
LGRAVTISLKRQILKRQKSLSRDGMSRHPRLASRIPVTGTPLATWRIQIGR